MTISVSKHHLSYFMQTDKNRRKHPKTVKYSGCMALGSNNCILNSILPITNCVSSSKLLNFLEAQFLTGKMEVIYQSVAARIHRSNVHQVLNTVPSAGKNAQVISCSLYYYYRPWTI